MKNEELKINNSSLLIINYKLNLLSDNYLLCLHCVS